VNYLSINCRRLITRRTDIFFKATLQTQGALRGHSKLCLKVILRGYEGISKSGRKYLEKIRERCELLAKSTANAAACDLKSCIRDNLKNAARNMVPIISKVIESAHNRGAKTVAISLNVSDSKDSIVVKKTKSQCCLSFFWKKLAELLEPTIRRSRWYSGSWGIFSGIREKTMGLGSQKLASEIILVNISAQTRLLPNMKIGRDWARDCPRKSWKSTITDGSWGVEGKGSTFSFSRCVD